MQNLMNRIIDEALVVFLLEKKTFLPAAQRHGHMEGGMVGVLGHFGPVLFLCKENLNTWNKSMIFEKC